MLGHEVADVGPEVDSDVAQAEHEGFPAGIVEFVRPFGGRLGPHAWERRCVESPWRELGLLSPAGTRLCGHAWVVLRVKFVGSLSPLEDEIAVQNVWEGLQDMRPDDGNGHLLGTVAVM